MSKTCNTCRFWTRTQSGICSQKMLTVNNQLVTVQTLSDYGCIIHRKDIESDKVMTIDIEGFSPDEKSTLKTLVDTWLKNNNHKRK